MVAFHGFGMKMMPFPQLFRFCMLLSVLLCTWGEMALAEGGKSLYPSDILRIKQRGRIVVAQLSATQAGFFEYASRNRQTSESPYLHQGKPMTGVDIDLGVRLAETLGVGLEIDRSAPDFDTVCEQVALGKADVGISKLSVTLKRAQYVRFTEPYALLPLCLLVTHLHEARSGIRDNVISYCRQERVSIGIYRKSALDDYLHQWFPRAKAVPYDNFEDQVQALLNGEIHFVLDDEFEVIHYLKAHPHLALLLRPITIPDHLDSIAVAVSPESPNLLALLNLLIRSSDIPARIKKMQTLEWDGNGTP